MFIFLPYSPPNSSLSIAPNALHERSCWIRMQPSTSLNRSTPKPKKRWKRSCRYTRSLLTHPTKLSIYFTMILPPILLLHPPPFITLWNIQEFLTKYSESNLQFSDSNINFGRHQILECARDALEKSKENTLSKDQIIAMCDNLEGTLVEVMIAL